MARASIAAVIACGLGSFCPSKSLAQPPGWSVPSYGIFPGNYAVAAQPPGLHASGWQAGATAGRTSIGAKTDAPHEAPLARVIKNPDESSGLPPYALADNVGTIQRYVEPVPGIELEPYVGTVVRVRHDTGRTLLASQLDLPPQPLESLAHAPSSAAIDMMHNSSLELMAPATRIPQQVASETLAKKVVRPAEFLDDDDASVQLLADTEEQLPDGGEVPSAAPSRKSPTDMIEAAPIQSDGCGPGFPEGMTPDGMTSEGTSMGCDPLYGEPIQMYPGSMDMNGPMDMETPGAEYGMGGGFESGMGGPWEVCPGCGRYHVPPGSNGMEYGGVNGEPWGPACQCGHASSRFFADVQFNFLRAHIMENFAGKLSEKFEFSPRVIVGFEGTGKVDGRARYWHYGRDLRLLDNDGSIRIDLDVLDLEATRTVPVGKSAFLLAAGPRLANLKLNDDDGDSASTDLIGLTMAGDFETLLCQVRRGEIVGVCGARLSILGGDWSENGGSDFIPGTIQDDNVVVDEVYAGVAFATCYRRLDLHVQLGFEMQNWHSDVLAQFAGADSLGFVGPGIEIGAEF